MAFRFLKIFLVIIITFNLSAISHSKDAPASFADLAERLMPSVVNISTSQTVVTKSNPFPGFEFPQFHHLKICLKILELHKRKAYALGSGFIIDEKGIVITNNHVIKDADDILVEVNGKKNMKQIIGTDPLWYAVYKSNLKINLYQLNLEFR